MGAVDQPRDQPGKCLYYAVILVVSLMPNANAKAEAEEDYGE
jgi:hypothetical protein